MSAATQNEMDRVRRERDAYKAEYLAEQNMRQIMQDEVNRIEKERDALAAHVARLRGLGQLVRDAATDMANIGTEELFDRAEKWDAALEDEPTTSLARLAQHKPPIDFSSIGEIATHRCSVCGAHWSHNDDQTWSLWSANCGPCCDNEFMGDQIVPLTNAKPKEPKEPNHEYQINNQGC